MDLTRIQAAEEFELERQHKNIEPITDFQQAYGLAHDGL